MQGKSIWRDPRAAINLVKPSRSVAVIVASTLLGFLLTVQLQSALNRPPSTAEVGRELSSATIQRLEEEQRSLKESIAQLRAELFASQQSAGSGFDSLASLSEELDRQRMAAGLTTLHGPGVVVSLDDSGRAVPSGDDAANYLIHDYELRDVVNLLWLAGAEAVSINDERLVASTSVYCVGSTIIVNETRLSPPYDIKAIGNAAQLENTLQDPGVLKKLKGRARQYGIQLKIAQNKELTLPSYTGRLEVKHANPSGR